MRMRNLPEESDRNWSSLSLEMWSMLIQLIARERSFDPQVPRWRNGSVAACHTGDQSSIPGVVRLWMYF